MQDGEADEKLSLSFLGKLLLVKSLGIAMDVRSFELKYDKFLLSRQIVLLVAETQINPCVIDRDR